MTPEDAVRCRATRRGQTQSARVRELDEPVGPEPPEHLRCGLGAHAEVAADLRRRRAATVAGHHPERQEVLLRGRRQVARVVAPHPETVRDRRTSATETPTSHAIASVTPSTPPAAPGSREPPAALRRTATGI